MDPKLLNKALCRAALDTFNLQPELRDQGMTERQHFEKALPLWREEAKQNGWNGDIREGMLRVAAVIVALRIPDRAQSPANILDAWSALVSPRQPHACGDKFVRATLFNSDLLFHNICIKCERDLGELLIHPGLLKPGAGFCDEGIFPEDYQELPYPVMGTLEKVDYFASHKLITAVERHFVVNGKATSIKAIDLAVSQTIARNACI